MNDPDNILALIKEAVIDHERSTIYHTVTGVIVVSKSQYNSVKEHITDNTIKGYRVVIANTEYPTIMSIEGDTLVPLREP